MTSHNNKRCKVLIILIILIVFAICFIADLWISSNYLIIRNYTVEISKANGQTIQTVVISDLHDHQFGSNNQRLVEKIEAINPDIILMDGDMLNAESDNALVPRILIQQLKDVAPVYYALGNHENAYISNGHADLIEQLEEAGAVVLDKSYD